MLQIEACLGLEASKSEKDPKQKKESTTKKRIHQTGFWGLFLDPLLSRVRKTPQARPRAPSGLVLEPYWIPFAPLTDSFGRSMMQQKLPWLPVHTHGPTPESHPFPEGMVAECAHAQTG